MPSAGLGLVTREVTQLADHLKVLQACEQQVDRRELAGEADDGSYPGGISDDVQASHLGPASIGLEERRQDPNERGLAGSVRTEKSEDLACFGHEVDVDERPGRSECLGDLPCLIVRRGDLLTEPAPQMVSC